MKKTKIIGICVMLATMLAVIMLSVNGCGNAEPSEGLEFELNNDGRSYSVVGIGNYKDSNVVIPAEYNDLPVASIGDRAFYDCNNLSSIEIPSSVTSIGNDAFWGCESLTSITYKGTKAQWNQIEKEISWDEYTGNYTVHCTNGDTERAERPAMPTEPSEGLKFKLNDDGESYSIVGIGTCKDTNIVIPAEYNDLPVTSIGYYAFQDCNSLTSIEIPSSVTSIGRYAFSGCSSLTSIEIPSSVTSIGWGAFSRCSGLTSITTDDNNPSYESIDGILFSIGQTALVCYPAGKTETDYIIPSSVTSIGFGAFEDCKSLTSIEIPSSVTYIWGGVFQDCDGLTSIEIPSSVTSLEEWAFNACSNLTSIEIPSSVTSIGDWTFFQCRKLTSITYKGTKTQWNQIEKGISWDEYTGNYTIHCTDGDIKK